MRGSCLLMCKNLLPSPDKGPVTEGSSPSPPHRLGHLDSMARGWALGIQTDSLFQTGELLQVPEPLLLVHAGMQSQWHDIQDFEEPREAFDAGDTVGKH